MACVPLNKPVRLLDVGSGNCACSRTLRESWPTAGLFALDINFGALQEATNVEVQRINADIRALPFRPCFDVILVRHPDLHRAATTWDKGILAACSLLVPGGLLIVTCYSAPEVDRLRTWQLPLQPFPLPIERLTVADMAGHDRYALAWINQPDAGPSQ